ncbi:FAD-dependent oxidoreductase [Falsihalocynthiibacter sp. SS001]|uniref:FAD-dependent oxidoreductase n=1 Tax=Falsihalocynthiibacter sp. SS001 TaxID=3349698 RepID=UPI0036D210C8
MSDVTIKGAGVLGLCIATELVARGVSVRLFDLEAELGGHACSWWAGGMLAPYCEGANAEEAVVRLGQEAAPWWKHHTTGVQENGTLVLALGRDHADLTQFARRTTDFIEVNGEEIGALEPDLAGRFSRGLFFGSEGHLAPRAALEQLRTSLISSGVKTEVDPNNSLQRVDCTGLSAKSALHDLRGVKGEMLVIRCPEISLARPVRLLHPRIPLYIVPRCDGVFMLGATMIEASDRTRITARSMLELLSAAYALHPAFGEAEILEIGVDARPAFPDNLPRLRDDGTTLFANGLYRHGFLLAPAIARMTAEYLIDGQKPEVMDAYFR